MKKRGDTKLIAGIIVILIILGIGGFFLLENRESSKVSDYLIIEDIGNFTYLESISYPKTSPTPIESENKITKYDIHIVTYQLEHQEALSIVMITVLENPEQAKSFLDLSLNLTETFKFGIKEIDGRKIYQTTENINPTYEFSSWTSENKVILISEPKPHKDVLNAYLKKY